MPRIQKRTTTFGSAQPAFSKWWCRGAIRRRRRPVPLRRREYLNHPTWRMTERDFSDEDGPTIRRRNSALRRMARTRAPRQERAPRCRP